MKTTRERKPEKAKAAAGRAPSKWQRMSRKQRREWTRKIQADDVSLEVVHPDAAGIDIGNECPYLAVPSKRDSEQPVRRFGCVTAELQAMAEWLKQCGIRTGALQSTGVYGIPVYDIVEAAGLEVYLVNARETKNLPGQKTDVQESPWLMKLPTYGLLRNSFRPTAEIRRMRNYWRQRNDLIQSAGRHIQRMQKVLTERNVQLAHGISDWSGVTGQAIVKAILGGERDPHKLAELRDPRIQATPEQMARSLEGNWQEDLLFILRQEHEAHEFCHKQIAACDQELKEYLNQQEDRSQGAQLEEEKRKNRRHNKKGHKPQQFDMREALFRMTGVDLTRIDGIDVMTAATVISEAGWDMSKWRTQNHFVSWLRLCPDNQVSGQKIIGKGRLPTNNRLTTALKIAATSLKQSETYLGAQFRRLRTRLGSPGAIQAMAAKLARLVYGMLRYGMRYVDRGAQVYEEQHRQRQILFLKRKAAELGLKVVETAAA